MTDAELVEHHLGVFLVAHPEVRRLALCLVASERERCIERIKHWFGGDSMWDRGYECVREIQSGRR